MLQNYQDGDTRNIGGVSYVRQGGQWRAQGGAAARPSAPSVIGTPRPREAPLHTQETPAESTIDQGRAAAAPYDAPTARANADRAAAEAQRATLQLQIDQRNAAAGPAANATESAGQAAGFFERAYNANRRYGAGVAPRSPLGQTVADLAPSYWVNANTDQARQSAETQAREFVAATLRRESGAAINPSEYASQFQRYFPQPGDSAETIAAKAQLRDTAIHALRQQAGALADPAQARVDEVLGAPDTPPVGGYSVDDIRHEVTADRAHPAASVPDAQEQQHGPIAFNGALGETPAPPPPPGPTVPPGGAEFAGTLQAAIRAGHFHNVAEAMLFARQLDPQLAMRINQRDLAAAIRDPRSAAVAVPTNAAPPPPPPPDISGSRGSDDAQRRAFMENGISANVPLLGPLTQADQALRGPEAANALLHGGQDWALFGGRDELNAAGNALLGQGNYDQNIGFERAVDNYDNQHHFGDRLAGQIAVGAPEALLPGSIPAQMARGGVQGALYGFGSGEGNFAQRAPNAVLGGTIGAVAPPAMAGAGAVIRPVARRVVSALRGTVTPEGQAVAQAADAEGVRISRPIAEPSARDRMMHLEASRGSGDLIREPLANTANDIEARAGQLGAGGAVEEPGTMGARIQGAGQRFIRESRAIRDRLYSRAASLAGNATVMGRDAVAEIDRHLAELSGNPTSNAAEITFMRGLRSDLVDDQGNLIPKTIAQIRDLRTGLRGRVSNANLLNSPVEGRVLTVLDAARNDISRDLTATAPRAVAAYARADAYNTLRHNEIKQVVQRVIGPRDNNLSGEQVWEKFRTMAGPRGNSAGVGRLWNRLSAEEQRDAAATLAARASPNDDFTAATFVKLADSLSPAATRTIFGPEGAQSIANLRTVARALQQTEKRLNNSRSGAVNSWREAASRWREALGGILGSVGTVAAGGGGGMAVATAVGGAAIGMASRSVGVQMRRMSARALMNPDMSRWLATGARLSTPQAIRSHIGRLSAIASRDPAIAQEVLALRQGLLHGMNDNAPMSGSVAASPDQGPANQQQSQ